MLTERAIYDETHTSFRDAVRRFASEEIAPHFERWELSGIVDRSFWHRSGERGLLCPQVPEEYGGVGADFRTNSIVIEELGYAGFAGPASDLAVHSDVCCGYLLHLGTSQQKARWLPRMVTGQTVAAIAMTEPNAGSDLRGIRTRAVQEGTELVVSGQKTFISNGQMCDLVIVVALIEEVDSRPALSLILVEADRPGFRRGRNLRKLGHLSADTSELFFDDVRVPLSNLLGERGQAMRHLMNELPQERLTIAIQSMAAAQRAFDITRNYVRERRAFGKSLSEFQNTRFRLADLKADLAVGWAYVDQCIVSHVRARLSMSAASIAKLWATEMHGRVVDQCLQLFGGYGFMRESEICRLYADARVQRIYGGTSEIMREIIARDL